MQTAIDSYPSVRHMHPREVAMFNGVPSRCLDSDEAEVPLRLLLAGTGQIVSPIQSAWVYAHVLEGINKALEKDTEEDFSPGRCVWNLCAEVFRDRDRLRGEHKPKTRDMQIFEKAIRNVLQDPEQERPEGCQLNDKGQIHDSEPHVTEHEPVPAKDPIEATSREERKRQKTCGVVGFETKEREENVVSTVLSPTMPFEVQEPEKTETAQGEEEEQCIHIWVSTPQKPHARVKVALGTTAGQVTVATSKLGVMPQPIAPLTTVGTILSLHDRVWDGQSIHLADGRNWSPSECPCRRPEHLRDIAAFEKFAKTCRSKARNAVLELQGSWVANDEMEYYLLRIAQGGVDMGPLLYLDEHDDLRRDVEEWLAKCIDLIGEADGTAITAILYKHHWMPLLMQHHAEKYELHTADEAVQILATAANQAIGYDHSLAIIGHATQQCFPADCGFQCIQWLKQQLSHPVPGKPMTAQEAETYRLQFKDHVYAHRQDIRDQDRLDHIRVGGTKGKPEDLVQLLAAHGVASDRIATCAEHLISRLTPAVIEQVMRGPNPWADLKARANQSDPPIKIVLAAELQRVVEQRLESKKAFGSKKNKETKTKTKSPAPITVRADQIEVPQGVFCQQGGKPLEHLPLCKIGPAAPGIAVVHIEAALPYLSLQHPITPGFGDLGSRTW